MGGSVVIEDGCDLTDPAWDACAYAEAGFVGAIAC